MLRFYEARTLQMFCAVSESEILSLLEEFALPRAAEADAVIDYFGAAIPIACAPYLASRAGSVLASPPYPSDTIRASFIEYLPVVQSIRDSSLSRYQMVELGASYAPFALLSAKLAQRKGIQNIEVCAVEAAKNGPAAITCNFHANGYSAENIIIISDLEPGEAKPKHLAPYIAPNVRAFVINSAFSSKRETLWFPDVDCTVDNGATVSNENLTVDCRGASYQHVPVRAHSLSDILTVFDKDTIIDLAHIDIQGAELDVIPDSIALFNERVKKILLGTHSRLIEGKMLELFHRNGWTLIAEEPCGFHYNRELDDFVGMTRKDGSQYWANTRLSQAPL